MDLDELWFRRRQKKKPGRETWLFKILTRVLTFGYSLKAWCPVRDSNPHARALGSKPNVSTNSTNWASRYVRCTIMQELKNFGKNFLCGFSAHSWFLGRCSLGLIGIFFNFIQLVLQSGLLLAEFIRFFLHLC